MTAHTLRYEDMVLYRRQLQSGGGLAYLNACIASYLVETRSIIIEVQRTIWPVIGFGYRTLRLSTANSSRLRAAIRVAEIIKSP